MTEELVFPEPATLLLNGSAVWAQTCTVESVREACYVEAFGEEEPVAVLSGKIQYRLTLKRVRCTGSEPSWYPLANFTLEIQQGERSVTYYGCEWESIKEETDEDGIYEEMVLRARYRTRWGEESGWKKT